LLTISRFALICVLPFLCFAGEMVLFKAPKRRFRP
jgi:hypothetical protein